MLTLQADSMNRFAALLCILLLGSSAAVQAQDIVATVDGEEIAMDSFDQSYKAYLASTGVPDAPRLRRAVLAQIVNDRLVIADGRRQGLDDSEAFRHFEAFARQKLLLESYLANEVLNSVEVTDGDVEEAFVRINTEIEARHLFARDKETADRLHQRVLAGESFEDLAREVFADPALAENGGSIGRFTFDELDPDFEDAAFELGVGEISEPVRTVQGYSVIQVLDRFTKPMLTEMEYAQRKDKLRGLVLHKKRVQARSRFARAKSEQLRPTFHPAAERLLGQLTGVGLIPDEAMDDFLREPLVSFEGADGSTTWTVAELRDQAAFTPAEQRGQVRTEADLRDFVTGLIVRVEMLNAAEEMGLHGRPEFERAMTVATDEWVLERQKEGLIAGVEVPEDSIRAHFARYTNEFIDENGAKLTYDEARPKIAEQLHLAYTRTATMELIASLRRSAEIEINEGAVRAWKLSGHATSSAGAASTRPSDERAESLN